MTFTTNLKYTFVIILLFFAKNIFAETYNFSDDETLTINSDQNYTSITTNTNNTNRNNKRINASMSNIQAEIVEGRYPQVFSFFDTMQARARLRAGKGQDKEGATNEMILCLP